MWSERNSDLRLFHFRWHGESRTVNAEVLSATRHVGEPLLVLQVWGTAG